MKKFIVEDSFWDVLPDVSLGVVVVNGLTPTNDVSAEDSAAIAAFLQDAITAADQHLVSNTISQNPSVAVWRDAYSKFKTKKGARASVENLLKRVLKGNPVGHITPSVDIYNAISMKYAMCVGGEDIDTFVGDARLGTVAEGLAFRGVGEEEDDPTLDGEICYYDEAGAICRCWNWRDGQRTMLTDTTSNAFLIVENVDPARVDDVAAAADELAEMLQQHLGATVYTKAVLTRDNPEVVIAD